ncbi:septal ring lytic transglycosylase RlpA family protein [Thermoactinospora rubra]|uniref:septal ring lytic transglycosylase RlpA family protein n=1 Tax=Thermoactinospora rubra TaxID=1088767 RepID=UPI001F0A9103|nr:septal ring lytic transglycosylase RlpA family protein [Thermoactinospora rubra]
MGQHSSKPSRQFTPVKRGWTAVAAGAAVLAAASTAAWATVARDEAPAASAMKTTAGAPSSSASLRQPLDAAPSTTASTTPLPTSSPARQPNSAARPAAPRTPAATASPSSNKGALAKPLPAKATPAKAKPRKRVIASGACGASYYAEGQMTASGERFNPSAMTAAHKTLPMGSKVRVTNPSNGDSVVVRINDRGPYVGGRCLDLSRAAFDAIGNLGSGVMRVKYEVLAR